MSDFCGGLRVHTPARIGLDRHGETVFTDASLELAAAHAEARHPGAGHARRPPRRGMRRARLVLTLIDERPGRSASDSLDA